MSSTLPNKPRADDDPHLVGYARVSTSAQSLQRQVDELVKYGVWDVDIFADKASGKNMDRTAWEACNKDMRRGDTLVVHSLDRLGRNLGEVIEIEKDLTSRGIGLKVLAQDINTSTASGRLVFHILMTVAQFEREWGNERTMHGLQKARERGITGGRDPQYSDEQIVEAMEKHNLRARDAAIELGCTKVTVLRRWNKIQEKRLHER